MKKTAFTTPSQPTESSSQPALLTLNPTYSLPSSPTHEALPGETIRHILLGSPNAIRQTIHLLHTLRYAEPLLWSPILQIEDPLILTPEQGEAMSLLRRAI